NGNQYFVGVQYSEDPGLRLEDVLNIQATGTNQSSPVTLSSLVHLNADSVPVEINHVDLARVYNVLVNTENRDIGGVAGDIQRVLKDVQAKEWQQNDKLGDKALARPNK